MTNKVFFLGAGFSKAVRSHYPLMGELTQQVFERLKKESVRKHLDEIPPLVKQDIESLLTYLSTDSPWKTDATKYENKALYSAIVKILSDIFLTRPLICSISTLLKSSLEISAFSTNCVNESTK